MKFLSLLFVLLLLAFAELKAESLFTPTEESYLASKGPIKMCVDPTWEPIEKIDEQGSHVGMAAEYIAAVKKASGLQIELYPTKTWKEALLAAQNRNCDIFSAVAKTPERSTYMLFTTPYLEIPSVVIGTKGTDFVSDLRLITQERIGINEGYATVELLKQKYPGINLIEVKDTPTGLLLLEGGQLDYFVDFISSGSFYIAKQGHQNLQIVGSTGITLNLSLASRKDEPLLREILQKAIDHVPKEIEEQIFLNSVRIQVQTATDYGPLITTLLMALAIILAVIFWNRSLQKEVRRRKEAEERALEAIRTKDRFFSIIAHDLRGPIGNIAVVFQMIAEQNSPLEQELLESLQKSTMSLHQLLDDLLSWSNNQSGRLELKQQSFNIHQTLTEVAQLMQGAASLKNIEIRLDPQHACHAFADKNMIGTVIRNLLGNAIKFTPIGGKITIGCEPHKKKVRVTVSDTGVGFNEKTAKNLLSLTHHTTSPGTDNEMGSGLGLVLCKDFLERNGSKIQFSSIPGKGSHFWFDLPQSESMPRQLSTDERQLLIRRYQRVLVVEDDLLNLKTTSHALRSLGFHFGVAHDGLTAIEMAKQETFDLILMDIDLPKLNGAQSAQIILSEVNPCPTLFALTSFDTQGIEESFGESQFDQVLNKPLQGEKLLELLSELNERPD